jgi:MOSC domain-containing protein YiiM
MDPARRAVLEAGRGIAGNADQGSRRQVTLLHREEWDRRVAALNSSLDCSARRANLVVTGISLRESRQRILQIGTCRIRILGETKPCHRMDEAQRGLKDALYFDWGGGAFGEVLDSGEIAVGDPVRWAEPE